MTTVLLLLLLLGVALPSALATPLFLSPLIEADKLSQARKESSVSLSRLYSGTSHAGYLTADRQLGNHLYFWYFPSQQNSSAPLLLWLNGGPGVSSLLGVFWENGPVMIDPLTSTLKPRPSTWVGPFSVLYIDNPVGVGFSFSDSGVNGTRLTREAYTDDLYSVLRQFYQIFPENYDLDLYIGGQSYAGKYISALGRRIHENNKKEKQKLPLVGVYIGGPLINLEVQYLDYYDFVYGMGFENKATLEARKERVKQLGQGRSVYEIWVTTFKGLDLGFPINDNFHDPVIPDPAVEKILADSEILEALHVANITFKTFNFDLNIMYGDDMLRPSNYELAVLLENYKVLIYNGNYDCMVPSSSTDAALLSTPWSRREQFRNSTRSAWKSAEGQVRGYFSQTDNLCRVVVHRAGLQTSHDQPEACLEMMENFVTEGCLKK